jgi:hypothetical protein
MPKFIAIIRYNDDDYPPQVTEQFGTENEAFNSATEYVTDNHGSIKPDIIILVCEVRQKFGVCFVQQYDDSGLDD